MAALTGQGVGCRVGAENPNEQTHRTYLKLVQIRAPCGALYLLDNVRFRGFGMSIVGRFAEFEFDFPIEVLLADSGDLKIYGVAPTMEPATLTGSSVSIPFYGAFAYYRHVPPEPTVDHHTCESDHAIMTFSPRRSMLQRA